MSGNKVFLKSLDRIFVQKNWDNIYKWKCWNLAKNVNPISVHVLDFVQMYI